MLFCENRAKLTESDLVAPLQKALPWMVFRLGDAPRRHSHGRTDPLGTARSTALLRCGAHVARTGDDFWEEDPCSSVDSGRVCVSFFSFLF